MRGSRKVMEKKEWKVLFSVVAIILLFVIYSKTYSTFEECMVKELRQMQTDKFSYIVVDNYCKQKFKMD